ncbi:hypothetical protein [Cellvibrio mixtus]|uniref:hypothetical protein n=1 Tax=Cellvibrio mixtus TaxID=39650 RepID=UPI00114082A6|nr:hypothetical protein [Cellvibrio mixtus]
MKLKIVLALLVIALLVTLSILHFPIGMAMFVIGNLLIVFSVIRIRLKSHGVSSLMDPVIGMTQKLSLSKHPATFIGLVLSASFLVGLILKFCFVLIVS